MLKQFPYLYPPDGKETYIPRIFGFKIFSQTGSKYAYEYNFDGNCTNQKEVDKIIEKSRAIYKKKMERKKIKMEYSSQQIAFQMEYGEMINGYK